MQLMSYALTWMLAHIRSERGQDLIEYALLGGLIAAAIVGIITLGLISGAVSSMATNIGYCIDFKKSTTCGPF